MARSKRNPLFANLFDEVLSQRDSWDHTSFSDLFHDIKKELVERILEKELETRLGYEKHQKSPSANRRNGVSDKTIVTETGPLTIGIPRDREGQFDPLLIPSLVELHKTVFQVDFKKQKSPKSL